MLLGTRAGGETYRPDEVAQLAEAAREVGLDLQMLRADARDGDTLAALRAQLDRIEAGLGLAALPRTA